MSCIFPPTEKIFIKRGSTLIINRIYLGPNGIPIPLTDYSLFSQVRNSTLYLIQELSITIPDQTLSPGQYTLLGGVISDWPIDSLYCDVKILDNTTSVIVFTETFQINVLEQITQE